MDGMNNKKNNIMKIKDMGVLLHWDFDLLMLIYYPLISIRSLPITSLRCPICLLSLTWSQYCISLLPSTVYMIVHIMYKLANVRRIPRHRDALDCKDIWRGKNVGNWLKKALLIFDFAVKERNTKTYYIDTC